MNGSGVPVFHFTNTENADQLLVQGVGFEQAVAGGKFLFIENTVGTSIAPVNIIGCNFSGNPGGGGHSAIELEKVITCNISGCRIEGSLATGNFSIKADVDCANLIIDRSNRIPAAGLSIAASRTEFTVGTSYDRV